MALKIETKVVQTIELRDIPYRDWPEEAKQMTRDILSMPIHRKRFDAELFKQDWLVSRIEGMQAFADELKEWMKPTEE